MCKDIYSWHAAIPCVYVSLPVCRTIHKKKKKKKKKTTLHTSFSQLRANQAPDPPWEDRLTYTDQIDVIEQHRSS